MKKAHQNNQATRRQFFSQIFHVSALRFIGCPKSLADMKASTSLVNSSCKNDADEMYCRTYEKAFEWRYNHYIATMEMLANYLGWKRLIELIKKSADDINKLSARNDPSLILKDFAEAIMKGDFFKMPLIWKPSNIRINSGSSKSGNAFGQRPLKRKMLPT